jgi:hypothetical protein
MNKGIVSAGKLPRIPRRLAPVVHLERREGERHALSQHFREAGGESCWMTKKQTASLVFRNSDGSGCLSFLRGPSAFRNVGARRTKISHANWFIFNMSLRDRTLRTAPSGVSESSPRQTCSLPPARRP